MRDLTVSAHAIVRWLQRVDGIEFPAGMKDYEIVAELGPVVQAWVVRRINKPSVRLAAHCGALRIASGKVTLCLDRRMHVVTVVPRRKRNAAKIDRRYRTSHQEIHTWE